MWPPWERADKPAPVEEIAICIRALRGVTEFQEQLNAA
jgi:hypothetical protein